MAENANSVLVAYGSETGNSWIAASELSRELYLKRFDVNLKKANDVITELNRYGHIIFITSTTGQGDPPKNFIKFWEFLLPQQRLQRTHNEKAVDWGKIKFSVFGLGDSRYPEFNVVARRLQHQLCALGCVEFYRMGLGDDQHDFGYEGEFDPWLENVLNVLCRIRNKTNPGFELDELPRDVLTTPAYTVIKINKQTHIKTEEQRTNIFITLKKLFIDLCKYKKSR